MNELEQQIVSFWGLEGLNCWSFDMVSKLRTSDNSKTFLMKVGLPVRRGDSFWLYDTFCSLEMLDEYVVLLSPTYPVSKIQKGYRVLACQMDSNSCICICENTNSIVSYAPYDDEGIRFVNTTVEQFVSFLTIMQKHIDFINTNPSTKQRSEELEAGMLVQLLQLDPEAFTSPESVWSVVAEEIRYGV